jgi:nitrogen-specific signal transduction histidine kinase/CheY-like chemotaxis protein
VATSAVEISGQRRTLASFRDFTERESLEAKLRQAQKMEAIGSLAGGIAHDFNNLLGSVLMELAALQEQMGAGHPARESIDTITRVTRRGTELTRRLLGFARREPHKEGSLSLNDVVASVEHLCARTFDPGVTIETRLALDLPLTLGDAGQIEQALLNLCINARDAMPGGGTITLSTRTAYLDEASGRAVGNLAAGNYVVLSVTDTGMGMTAEVRQRLFEPFFTTKERGKGTGLGLAMVHGIIQGHRGGVGVWSEPDKGTRIDLCLPLVAPPAAAGDAEPLRPVALPGTETVLVIDDEAPLRRAVVRALERLGYTVLQAENGRVGVALFEKHRNEIEIVLLDVAMPEMSGVEVFRRLRAGREDVPVLVCSGYAETAELQTLHLEGADGFLNKPFDVVDLARAVRAVLDERAVTVGARRPVMESKPG